MGMHLDYLGISSPTLAIAATAVLTPCVSEPISVIPFQFCEPIPTSSKL